MEKLSPSRASTLSEESGCDGPALTLTNGNDSVSGNDQPGRSGLTDGGARDTGTGTTPPSNPESVGTQALPTILAPDSSSIYCSGEDGGEEEWSPEAEEVAVVHVKGTAGLDVIRVEAGGYAEEEDDGVEEDEEEEDDQLYSEGSDVEGVDSGAEYTDYENEEIVNYQAAVDVSTVPTVR